MHPAVRWIQHHAAEPRPEEAVSPANPPGSDRRMVATAPVAASMGVEKVAVARPGILMP
jgi:hypothetical protein